jgi:hypothetical protein
MKTRSLLYDAAGLKHNSDSEGLDPLVCQLVLGFGSKKILQTAVYEQLRSEFPAAQIAMCSTAGEIYGNEVSDDSLSVVAVEFEKTRVGSASVEIDNYASSFEAGAALVEKLSLPDLKYIFVLSDGGKVNGSELVRGVESKIRHNIPVTGGLAGDGARFVSTLVGLNGAPKQGQIIAVGFYGDAIEIGHGSMGGWEMFGLEKTITRSVSNELFEIDHVNALDLYKQYLGKYAEELPGSALLFPLSLKLPDASEPVVRTILSINLENNSMVFAGDVPEGARVRFMKANFDKLIDAASGAALSATIGEHQPKLAILISCVGRKLILGNRIEEEVDAVNEVFMGNTMVSGFYSYGEISPFNPGSKCELHNQTMTITTFDER